MTPTDELRRLLDELGVEWQAPTSFDGTARHDTIAGGYWFHEFNGKITVHGLTPEQAIAATLGSSNCTNGERTNGTCHDVCNSVDEFTCSACGFNCDVMSWTSLFDGDVGRHRHHHHGTPNFCPNCGRKVVP